MDLPIDIAAYRYVDFVQSVMRGAATIDATLQESFAQMIAPTVQQLVSRASDYPFPGARIVMGEGARAESAIAFYDGFALASAYEPIFDVSTRGLPQSLTASVESAQRFGDELGFQALTLTADGAPFDPFAQLDDDPRLVELDRLSRALHAFNFFGAQRPGLLFLRVHERLLKSVKYDHGKHFSSVLVEFGLNPARIVIELPSAAVAHRTFLGYLVKSYQKYGFKVAGNLANAGQVMAVSDMARLDFIKMDAGAALRDSVVKPLVGYAHRLKIPLIFSNVADEAQFDALQQFDVNFVQGPAFEVHEG